LAGLDVETVQANVSDPASLKRAFAGAERVYHTAAFISVSGYERDRLERVNVQGARNVVEACLHCGVQRLVHFSSIEALVDEPLHTPVDEARPLVTSRRYPAYARSKAAGERHVREGLERGLDAIILYPTAVVGPGDYRLGFPNRGLLAVCRGRLPALIDGGFDWVDVRDVVEGALLAGALAPRGGRYILSGQWASLRDLAGLAHEIWGVRVPRLVLPMWLAQVGALFTTPLSRLTRRPSLFTNASLRPLRANPQVSHARATRDLGYQPRPLKETVIDTWRFFDGR
jgi:dihydroflavonol-4-reductase